jgi:hypothetical protein
MAGVIDRPQLAAADFDGTIVLTSELGPGGVGVDEAYEVSVHEHLGNEAARVYITEQNGHQGRAPKEIVKSLRPDASAETLERLTAKVTATKLEILTDLIGKPLEDGTKWPRPTDGLREFWLAVYEEKRSIKTLGTAVISAGHTEFQKRTFDYLDLPYPDIFVSDDVLQALSLSLPLERQVKPSPFMLTMAEDIWRYKLRQSGLKPAAYALHTVYAGNDEIKDAGIAKQAGVSDFELITPTTSREGWYRVGAYLGLGEAALAGIRGE